MGSIGAESFIDVDGVSNFRSIGGYPIKTSPKDDKLSTRQGFAFRSADPCYVTDSGRETILSLNIVRCFDLRSLGEVEAQNAKLASIGGTRGLGEHIIRHSTPLFPDQDWSPEAAGERYLQYTQSEGGLSGYVGVYGNMLEEGGLAIRAVLLHVRDHPTEPFLCHCSAGKDRTGVVMAILLKLAGCSDDTVAREYQLTEIGLARRMDFIIEHLLKKPELKGSREMAERIAGARYENMMETLGMMKSRYGGTRNYCKKVCGLTDEDLACIQDHLTSPAAPLY